MAACPYWLGFLLLNPLRRLMEDPRTILAPYVREGMTVLEPGCAMGFFTLELARLVGPNGRVVAVDLQEKMLENLRRRAQKAGLAERIETRLAPDGRLAVADLAGKVDLAVAIHMVHEVTDQAAFFAMVFAALKPGGGLLVREPPLHVGRQDFARSLARAEAAGFRRRPPDPPGRLAAHLVKP